MADGRRRYARACLIGVVAGLLAGATPVRAAGGPDFVDDAYAETPEICHFENWLTEPVHGGDLAHLGIGCTLAAVPRLEIDAAVERQGGNAGGPWSFQPGVKYTLLARAAAFAIGLGETGLIDRHGRADGIAVNLPVSIVRGRYTIIDLDAGCTLARGDIGPLHGHGTWGMQITQAFSPHFAVIGEVFGIDAHRPGGQAGVRWSPGPEKVDIDLRASHGGASPGSALTLGITIRV